MTNTIDFTKLFLAILSLLSVLISSYVIPWLRSKTNEKQQDILLAISKTAVFAAQQLLSDNISKKEYAVNYVENILKGYGISFDTQEISGAIEAVLKEAKISVENW